MTADPMAPPPPPTNPPAPDTTALTEPKPPKPPAPIGLMPRTVDEAWRLATIMAKSRLVPASYKDRPEDVMVAMMYGAEVGLTPAQAVTGVAVINGRPGLYGEALLAVIMSRPLYVDHDEYFVVAVPPSAADVEHAAAVGLEPPSARIERRDTVTSADLAKPTTAAVCTFVRHGAPRPTTREFSVADAVRARLFGKAGPWTEYPQVMLRMRARGFAARDTFPDVLRGLRTAEELMDTPPDAAAAKPPAPVVRRLSDPPPPETTRLEPARVDTVTQYDNGDAALVILSTGVRVVVPDLRDAHALAQLVDTDARVVVTVTRGPDDALTLASFVDAAVFDVDRPE
jgi:hypothetical protein